MRSPSRPSAILTTLHPRALGVQDRHRQATHHHLLQVTGSSEVVRMKDAKRASDVEESGRIMEENVGSPGKCRRCPSYQVYPVSQSPGVVWSGPPLRCGTNEIAHALPMLPARLRSQH